MKLKDLRKGILEEYQYVKDPMDREADLLLSTILHVDLSWIHAYPDWDVPDDMVKKVFSCIEERKHSRPLPYIFKEKYFYGRPFYVDENVLIPRPETEISVQEIKKLTKTKDVKILEIGVGSGAVCITLSLELPFATIHGVDISTEALNIAKKNAKALSSPVSLWKSNLFEDVNEKYDIIYSNPPYIDQKKMKDLPVSVLKYEPTIALDGGEDGLMFYKRIINECVNYLTECGYLVFEIGYDQRLGVTSILKESGFHHVKTIKDYQGNDRVVIAWR